MTYNPDMSIKDQFVYNIPGDWGQYLMGKDGLETFSFYPLLASVIFLLLATAILSFVLAKARRKNRPVSRYFRLFGKALLTEFFIGVFVVFSRWQVLGIFALRVALVLWLVSLPIAVIALLVVFFVKCRKEIPEANEEERLSKYKP